MRTLRLTTHGGLRTVLALAVVTTGCVAPRPTVAGQLIPRERVRIEGLPLRIRDAGDPGVSCAVTVVQGVLESSASDTLTLNDTERWRYPGQPTCTASSRIIVVLSESDSPRMLMWRPSPVLSFAAVVTDGRPG